MTESGVPTPADDALRMRAVRRLRKKRDLVAHLIVFILVNTFVVVVWAMTGASFFWPVFLAVPWGIGVVMNAWDVFANEDFSEERVRREMDRLST
jgi:hypothetical protein